MALTGLLFAFLLAATAGAACSHFQPVPQPLYPGAARPNAEVARLSGPVATVDGLAVPEKASLFALLPGCHVVELQPRIGEGSVSGAWSAEIRHRTYVFDMKAGSSYEIDVQLQQGKDALGSSTVGGAKLKAVERDARGAVVATFAPARNPAEIAACRVSAEAGGEQKPEPEQQGAGAPRAAPAEEQASKEER
jgi:hypothetical protein